MGTGEIDITNLPSVAFGFMLVVCRVGSALLAGPGLGENDLPPSIRIAFAVIFAVLVFPVLQARLPSVPFTIGELIAILGVEIVIGLWMGFLARALVTALSMTGALISFMAGLSSVLQLDPAIAGQATALQRMMSLAGIVLFFVSGLYLYPLQAIIGSYHVIPPGQALDTGGVADLATRAVSEGFGLSVRLAAPFIIASIVWHAALGFLGRLVPHINVQLVSAPAQILGGMALLAVAVTAIFESWSTSIMKALSSLPGL